MLGRYGLHLLPDEEMKDSDFWTYSTDFSRQFGAQSYLVNPYFDNSFRRSDDWDYEKSGECLFHQRNLPVEVKNDFFEYAFEHSDYKHFPDDYNKHVLEAEKHN